MLFAGTAVIATILLYGAAHQQVSPSITRHAVVTADGGDDNFVNDNGQTSGDIFQQNAQDQSTA
jgi:hypothetical protein